MQVESIVARPFPVPLVEPFTISRASVDSTRAVLVRADWSDGERRSHGFGEAALPLGASEQPADLIAAIEAAAQGLIGRPLPDAATIDQAVSAAFSGPAAARAGLHCALLDGWTRLAGLPLHRALAASAPAPLITDITLPIADPVHLGELAAGYRRRGFGCFKIKVGADLESDARTLAEVARATPDATLRFDANEGFAARDALTLLRRASELGLEVECFEQPCPRDDLDGLRTVREGGGVPVVADESVRDERDLALLLEARAADGVNLKLVKMGGIDRCLAVGRLALEHGLRLMVGAMIESRLGLTAMAHVATALGGADWVDLDTAFLLATDPWRGGMQAEGARLTLAAGPGLAIEPRDEARTLGSSEPGSKS